MDHAKKMVLVPEAEEACAWKEPMSGGGPRAPLAVPSTVQTPGDPVSRLDTELSEILHSKKYRDDAEKWKQYLQVLQRYLFLIEARNGPIDPTLPGVASTALRERQATPSSEAFDDSKIVNSVPQAYHRRATLLMNFLRSSPGAAQRIRWDNEGRVTIDGMLVPNSNILDLVNDAVRSRKGFRATGRREFIKSLRATAVPQEFIGNRKLWDLGAAPASIKRKRNKSAGNNEGIAFYNTSEEEKEAGDEDDDDTEEERADGKSIVKGTRDPATRTADGSKTPKNRDESINSRRGLTADFTPTRDSPKKKAGKKKDTTPTDSELTAVKHVSKRPAGERSVLRQFPNFDAKDGPIVIPRGFAYWLKL